MKAIFITLDGLIAVEEVEPHKPILYRSAKARIGEFTTELPPALEGHFRKYHVLGVANGLPIYEEVP